MRWRPSLVPRQGLDDSLSQLLCTDFMNLFQEESIVEEAISLVPTLLTSTARVTPNQVAAVVHLIRTICDCFPATKAEEFVEGLSPSLSYLTAAKDTLAMSIVCVPRLRNALLAMALRAKRPESVQFVSNAICHVIGSCQGHELISDVNVNAISELVIAMSPHATTAGAVEALSKASCKLLVDRPVGEGQTGAFGHAVLSMTKYATTSNAVRWLSAVIGATCFSRYFRRGYWIDFDNKMNSLSKYAKTPDCVTSMVSAITAVNPADIHCNESAFEALSRYATTTQAVVCLARIRQLFSCQIPRQNHIRESLVSLSAYATTAECVKEVAQAMFDDTVHSDFTVGVHMALVAMCQYAYMPICQYAIESMDWVWRTMRPLEKKIRLVGVNYTSATSNSHSNTKHSMQNAIQWSCAAISNLGDATDERVQGALLIMSTHATTAADVVTISERFFNSQTSPRDAVSTREAVAAMSRYATTSDAVFSLVKAIRHLDYGHANIRDAFVAMSKHASTTDAALSLAKATNDLARADQTWWSRPAVRDMFVTMSHYAKTPECVEEIARGICKVIKYGGPSVIVCTESVRDALVKMAMHATNHQAVQCLARAISSLCSWRDGGGKNKANCFKTANVLHVVVTMSEHATTAEALKRVWNAIRPLGKSEARLSTIERSGGRTTARQPPKRSSVHDSIQWSCATISTLVDADNDERVQRALLEMAMYATVPGDVMSISQCFSVIGFLKYGASTARDALAVMSRYATTTAAAVSLLTAIGHLSTNNGACFCHGSVRDAFIAVSRFITTADSVERMLKTLHVVTNGAPSSKLDCFRTQFVCDALVAMSSFATTTDAVQSMSTALRRFGSCRGAPAGQPPSKTVRSTIDAMSTRLAKPVLIIARQFVKDETGPNVILYEEQFIEMHVKEVGSDNRMCDMLPTDERAPPACVAIREVEVCDVHSEQTQVTVLVDDVFPSPISALSTSDTTTTTTTTTTVGDTAVAEILSSASTSAVGAEVPTTVSGGDVLLSLSTATCFDTAPERESSLSMIVSRFPEEDRVDGSEIKSLTSTSCLWGRCRRATPRHPTYWSGSPHQSATSHAAKRIRS